ncbi:hypothetical protein JNB62_13080 [Microbacterium jejuense]|uniref:Uncharacterized protein n=1 Tax=Microbacterium jejuense TaxID=1263637 RepID=A0ABS7HP31_9MICO|nr:hypothetical protein [Microbacterium jejuense]MBW9094623.1 hypothetical protein [Microbacterium jejuense]
MSATLRHRIAGAIAYRMCQRGGHIPNRDRTLPDACDFHYSEALALAALIEPVVTVPPIDVEREELIEKATWTLIEWDTDTADRGVRDEHYRERRTDVERIFPILFRRQGPITDADVERIRAALNAADIDYSAREQRADAGGADREPGDWFTFMARAALEAAQEAEE